jgi:hypothetical protein
MSFFISGLTLKVAKKLTDIGTITKYPNKTPVKNNREEIKINDFAYFLSFSYNAGLMKFHTKYNIYGKAIIKPEVIQVQINREICPSIAVF